ncbi:hypothetical protein CGLO_10505 [Colletotrichum gloeosporioides Cg-14]|uniref:Uncharacterized protein n=1 Tax=Colletotrichum gloeosporioides (strain Cg-14) TaxID=1237896 RepID=T0KAF3_COLGC|nr:hypothetical protein CGLO_10505 [Colletotrichum gloeosporioides Cg-14]
MTNFANNVHFLKDRIGRLRI